MTLARFLEPGIAEAAQTSLTWQLEWAPQAQVDGLKAFEGVEDDANHSDPGVKHVYADGTDYRIDMPLQERDKKPDRQRNEVKGMVDRDGNILRIEKGDTWRLRHRIFIPTSLQGTTSFTHIMQLLPLGIQGSGPIFTISLSRKNNVPVIALHVFTSGKILGSTPLTPLQETWIESQITFTASDNGNIQWLLKDSHNKTVVSAQGSAKLFFGDRVRPKWGIYRSVHDTAHLETCYMLITGLKAWKQVSIPNESVG
jgi:chitin-binding protein